MTELDIAASLQRSLRWLTAATCVLYLIVLAAAAVVWHDSHQTTASLCALRADVERRISAGEQFLAEHPHGTAGIPAASISVNIAGQRRTVKALSRLHCPPL